jgi:formate dehydrogenase subunit delta
MSPDKLVYMANQIGRYFAYQPDEKAIANTADHLKKYWDPRMRKAIFDHVAHGGAGLQPLVLNAVLTLKAAQEQADADRKKANGAA